MLNHLEIWGLKKVTTFYKLFSKPTTHYTTIEKLFHAKIHYVPLMLAFSIGVVFTLPIVMYEVYFGIEMHLESLLQYTLIIVLSVTLEFYFLFLLGFATLGYYIANLHTLNREHRLGSNTLRSSLVRVAMELPEKKIVAYHVDPYEYKEKRLFFLSLLYKLKVVLTNFVAKFMVRKVLSRSALRVYTPFISAPITGLWDAAIFWQTMKRARYKIVVRYITRMLLEQQRRLLEENIPLIQKRYYYFGEYESNLNYLLQNLYQSKPFHFTKEEYLTIACTEHKLFTLLLAFKYTYFTQKEKRLAKELGIEQEVYLLQRHIKNAKLDFFQTYIANLTSNP
jgi:hypothetical protein